MILRDTPADGLEEALRLDALERQRITDTPRDEAFDRIVQSVCAALSVPIAAIGFLDSERLWIKAGQGVGSPEVPREVSFCTHALEGDDVMVVEDAARDPRFAGNPIVVGDGVRFYAGVPLITGEGFRLGTLSVADHNPRQIGQRDRALLHELAAIVMGEMELRHALGTDPLTGLHTRSFFQEIAGRELIRVRRDDKPLAAAFVGADHLKHVNDSLGHAAGDAVLRAIGPAARNLLRESDLLGRYDGEELVVLMPGTGLRQAVPVLQRLRKEIGALDLPALKGRKITVSIGAAELQPEDLTIGDLLARAGAALHRAKDYGAGRLELAA